MKFVDNFELNGYVFTKCFSTSSSVSYSISPLEKKGLAEKTSWIDIHYPCNDHIKLQIRSALVVDPTRIKDFVNALMKNLEVDPLETYEIIIFDPQHIINMARRVNRHGISDSIETTRKWKIP